MANANAASKLYVCATAQNSDLTLGEFELLDWVQVGALGSHGETGKNTNILQYDTWDTTVIQKAKGMTDAGSPEIEVARLPTDAGQIILRAAGVIGNNNSYAFKMLRSDASGNGDPSVFYNRGLVTGPRRPHGRNEDFDLEMYTLALQQEEVVDDAGAATGAAPANTVAPALSGFIDPPNVAEVITVSNGTFTGDATITYTYQWYASGIALSGETANTLTVATAHIGKLISARVRASNSVGSAIGFSALTGVVAA